MAPGLLPVWEQWIYWVIGVSSIAYSWWRMFLEGDALRSQFLHHGFQKGWNIIGRYCDTSDSEWDLWRHKLCLHLGFCFTHIVLSQACRLLKFSVKVRMGVLVLFDLVCIWVSLGLRVIVFMLLKTGLVWITSQVGGVPAVWGLMSIQMLACSSSVINNAQNYFLGITDAMPSYSFLIANGFADIKLISFGIDNALLKSESSQNKEVKKHQDENSMSQNEISKVDERIVQKKECVESSLNTNRGYGLYMLEVLFFIFYFPSFVHGPIFLFNEFRLQVASSFAPSNHPNLLPREFKDICKNIVRLFLWMVFYEVSKHYLYFSALAYNSALGHLSLWALVAVGHSMGQFFMVKYVVFYGLSGQLGRLDGVVPPPEPRCISWVYSYTDMWKHFDTGLYNFIKAYVYVPLGGSRYGVVRQLAASGFVFLFIFVWHGGTHNLFIWCLGNYLVGSLESVASILERSFAGQKLVSLLGQRMMFRMKCLLVAPAYLASCLQTFYFLFHPGDAWIITERIVLTSTWTQFGVLIGIFYSCIHNAMFIRYRLCKHGKRA
ncbi:hypothetical protein EGW08_019688 [Elysia chlorotica]|uniref:Uncharacterized protein n=1 Tax=Elysia chlorotica TaxID=188477 RepID=A0A3S0Z7M5_ELYCH|nr:hypothetical protein EGW08_019688 [Elysia chlorotica]